MKSDIAYYRLSAMFDHAAGSTDFLPGSEHAYREGWLILFGIHDRNCLEIVLEGTTDPLTLHPEHLTSLRVDMNSDLERTSRVPSVRILVNNVDATTALNSRRS